MAFLWKINFDLGKVESEIRNPNTRAGPKWTCRPQANGTIFPHKQFSPKK